MEGHQSPLPDWEAYHFELLSLYPGCSTFEWNNYLTLGIQYIMKSLEEGRKHKFQKLHWDSIMPAHAMAQAFNLKRSQNTPPQSAEDYLVFKKIAYPEQELTFSPTTIATVHAIAKNPHPSWIHQSLPWGQLLGIKSKAEPAESFMLCSKNMVAIAPTFVDGWLKCELIAFTVAKEEVGGRITLYQPETNEPVIDLQLRQDVGQGYYQDEYFKILQFHKKDEFAMLSGGR
jgi:hypothetical protein